MARVPVLLALLLVARPAQDRLLRASNTIDMDATRWPWLVLVATPLVFMALALAARRTHHPPWLLTVEGVIAALLGLMLPLWGVWIVSGRFAWPPDALEPLAAALSNPMSVGGFAFGLGQAAHWFVILLALAWLVVVIDTPLAEFVNDMALIQGTTWYLRVLVLIWLVIVADAAVRQVRGSAPTGVELPPDRAAQSRTRLSALVVLGDEPKALCGDHAVRPNSRAAGILKVFSGN